jgi:hypothetical protein
MRFWIPSTLLLASVVFACGSSSSSDATSGYSGPADGGSQGSSGSGSGSGSGGFVSDGSLPPIHEGGSAGGKTLLYAHDATTLYQVDPTDPTLSIAALGTFDCIGDGGASSMTDIALDSRSGLYGLAPDTLFLDMKVIAGGVQCRQGMKPIVTGNADAGQGAARFYGQSFAPAGTLNPNNETLLVGNTAGFLYAVDTTSGALTVVGSFGTVPNDDGNHNSYPSDPTGGVPGSLFQMSGDIVFLANGGSPVGFATVRDCQDGATCSAIDTLLELDVSKLAPGNTGSVVKSVRGQIRKASTCGDSHDAYGSMYGIAAFQDKVIGFSHLGFIVSIDNKDGTACLIHDYSAGPILFDGAGVTTSAPVVAPPPK